MVLELQKPRPIWQIMFSTHHTDIGLLYLITSLAFFFMGGALALGIRIELFAPGAQIIADSMTFNRMFTVHGTTLIFLFILPFASAVGNYFVPIMVRYKDMAYPKLNAIAYWMIPPAGALPKAGPSQRCLARLKTQVTLLPHYLSLSVLPFGISSSSLLSI